MSMSQVGSGLPRLLAERYELVEQLASGSMTSVWRGHDRVLGRDVVVKVLHPDLAADAGLRGSFHQEAINAARLTHPNIVALCDAGSVKVADFSIAKAATGDDPGGTGELLAAGGYIAPEAADGGDPDGRAV